MPSAGEFSRWDQSSPSFCRLSTANRVAVAGQGRGVGGEDSLLERQVESRLLLAAAQPRMLVLLAESLRESVMDIGKQCLLAMVVILIGWGLVLPKAAVAAPAPAPALEQLPALEAEVALSFSSGGQDALNDPVYTQVQWTELITKGDKCELVDR